MSKYFIANWKMNLMSAESVALLRALLADLNISDRVRTVVCPSFTALAQVAAAVESTPVILGAQDVSWLDKGSLTGEISPLMLKEWSVEYVIVGHSERRQQLGETEEMINRKVQTILRHGLTPILCVGETFEERQQGRKDFVIAGQVESALQQVQLVGKPLLIAYEPVWVIGSGQAVKIEEAEHAARVIKQVLIDLYPDINLKEQVGILYGGSVDAKNISYFTDSDLLQGVLVGGASLQSDEFARMVNVMQK